MLIDVFESAKTPAEITSQTTKIVTAIKEKKLTSNDIGLREIAEATFGAPGMRKMMENPAGGFVVSESVAPVNLSAFSNITGQLIYQGVYDAYASPEFIGDQLVTQETSREDNTRVPGLAPIDDDAIVVEEGGEYPDVKFGEDYIDIPHSQKRGLKIGVTREMVFFDRTGMVMEMANTVGARLGLNREKRILRTVLGIDNSFKRKGVARQTYVSVAEDAADPRINELVATLTDYTSLDAVQTLFSNMKDDRTTKEPITVQMKQILVNDSLQWTARNILKATEVRINPGVTSGSSLSMPNPYANTAALVATPWVRKLLTDASIANPNTYWYAGDFKRAFRYRTLFPLQVLSAQHDKDSFERDVVAQFRADERGVPYIWAPWYVACMHA